MPTDVIMPQMGESIFEGTITRWLKKTGDTVLKDEPLFEISTDKVDAEIPSPVAGVLSETRTPEGKPAQTNPVAAVVSEAGAPSERPRRAAEKKEPPPSNPAAAPAKPSDHPPKRAEARAQPAPSPPPPVPAAGSAG